MNPCDATSTKTMTKTGSKTSRFSPGTDSPFNRTIDNVFCGRSPTENVAWRGVHVRAANGTSPGEGDVQFDALNFTGNRVAGPLRAQISALPELHHERPRYRRSALHGSGCRPALLAEPPFRFGSLP